MPRSTNVITRPKHEVWELQGKDEYKEWFQKAFPRLNMDELVSDEEWERFAGASGTTYPKCQYCPGFQVSHPSRDAGVVLVGDALHAFPPDIGQGINAGLGDVEALSRALEGRDLLTNQTNTEQGPPARLSDALSTYERVRRPEIQGLIRLARFGAPYQYKQSHLKDRIGLALWTANVGFRAVLNKLTRGLVPPPAIMRAMDKKFTYRKAMRDADLTTTAFMTCLFAIAWKTVLGSAVRKVIPLLM